MLAGAAGLPGIIPASIQKAMAINPSEGSSYLDAEHVVILMQENRSFDHCFGTLRGVRGYNDPRAIDLPNQNKVWLQSNTQGETYAPFHLDIKGTKATWMNSLPHSWANQVNARNDGKHDQWLNVKQSGHHAYAHMPLTMGYHTREDIPFYYNLADAFTVCDQNFCSSLTGTNPNRLYFWTGTIRGEQHEDSKAHVWNEDMDYGTLNWKTFPERLEENGISWKCYQNEMSIDIGFKEEEDPWLSNFQDNPLEFFSQYNIHLHPQHLNHLQKQLVTLPGEIQQLQLQIAALPAGDAHIDHLEKQLHQKQQDLANIKQREYLLTPGRFENLPPQQQSLHAKAFNTNVNDPDYHQLTDLSYNDDGVKRSMKVPQGDVLHQFRADVKNGELPMVSWITAPENFSDHPSAPWYGAWYISEVMDILTQNPEVWKKTIFILTYDENDGYFDHIPPFVAPHSHKQGTGKVSDGIDTRVEYVTLEQELARKDFPEKYNRECAIGLGYRVPMIIASPWSRGGYVNSEVFDHTSTLQFLEHFLAQKTGKDIRETNISEWRRTICGNLTSVFRPYGSKEAVAPIFVAKDVFLENIHKAQFKKLPSAYRQLTPEEIAQINRDPKSSPLMPQQESGIRPANALPYQLYADGKLSADKKSFEITFINRNQVFGKHTAGAPFNVYAPGKYLSSDGSGFSEVRTWAYGVKAGDQVNDMWPLHEFENSNYHLRIYGPNGFYREFTGDANDPQLYISANYQHALTDNNKLTGNVEIEIISSNHQPFELEIIDHGYKTNSQQKTIKGLAKTSIVLNTMSNYGWYDFSVKLSGHNQFTRRYAGRVETGKSTFSDPAMGNAIA